MERAPSIEVEQHLADQYRFWKFQRVAWAIMALVILAALLGFFGGAGKYHTERVVSGPLKVTYQQYSRFKAPLEYRIVVTGVSSTTPVRMEVSMSLLEAIEISSIVPQPHKVMAGNDVVIYEFEPPVGSTFSAQLQAKGQSIGSVKGVISMGEESVSVSQFIYP